MAALVLQPAHQPSLSCHPVFQFYTRHAPGDIDEDNRAFNVYYRAQCSVLCAYERFGISRGSGALSSSVAHLRGALTFIRTMMFYWRMRVRCHMLFFFYWKGLRHVSRGFVLTQRASSASGCRPGIPEEAASLCLDYLHGPAIHYDSLHHAASEVVIAQLALDRRCNFVTQDAHVIMQVDYDAEWPEPPGPSRLADSSAEL